MNKIQIPHPSLPRSLRGQFRLALSALVMLILAGGITAIHSLRTITQSSQSLAGERLARVQDSQDLVQHTLLIERNTYRLLSSDSRNEMQGNYAEIIKQLESFDALVARLGEVKGDVSVLDLYQAGQLFRNTTHVVVRLQEELLPDATVNTQNPIKRPIGARLRHFQTALEDQVEKLTTAADTLASHYTRDYQEAIRLLSTTSQHSQQLVIILFLSSLLLAWVVSKAFLGVHVVDRLLAVSQYLRFGESDQVCPLIPVRGDDEIGEMARAVEKFLRDHQRLVEAQRSLEQSEELMRTMTNAVQSGVLLIDNQDRIQFVNPAGEKLFGYAQEEIIGSRLHDILVPEPLRKQARAGLLRYAQTGQGALLNQPMEFFARRKDGSNMYVEIAVGRVRKNDQWWAVGSAIDISAHKSREEDLAQQAGTDPLTGVANRRNFMQLAEHELKRCRRERLSLFFLMFDLDHFKKVNDTYGHATGDEVLRAFAGGCHQNLRDSDLFGRIGGEEFAAVMTGLNAENALATAERIRTAFIGVTVPVDSQNLQIDTSVSIGMVRVDPGQDSVESGLKKADAALYQAKEQGRNRVVMTNGSGEPQTRT